MRGCTVQSSLYVLILSSSFFVHISRSVNLFMHRRDFRVASSRPGPSAPLSTVSYRKFILVNLITCILTMYFTILWTHNPLDFGKESAGATLVSQAAEFKKVQRLHDACEEQLQLQTKAPCPVCPVCPTVPTVPPVQPPAATKGEYGKTAWKQQALVQVSSVLSGSYGVDLGIPPLNDYKGDEQALLLYHGNAIPDDITDPLGKCVEVDVVITKRNDPNHCLLVMEHYQAYHVHRFMRLSEGKGKGKAGTEFDLRRVSRGQRPNGENDFVAPSLKDSKKHWEKLSLFMSHYVSLLKRLDVVLKKVHKDNAVVVMVVNAGMAELLANFVCAATARGIGVGNVVVFATDREVKAVAEDLGLAVFYDEEGGFGKLPSDEAKSYGDATFTAMMYAKVLSV